MATSNSLSGTWWSADDWPAETGVFPVVLTGSGSVELAWADAQPASAATGAPLTAGSLTLVAPISGLKPWFRVTSGVATLYYSEDTAIKLDPGKIGAAYDDGTTEDFLQGEFIWVGFDDSGAASTEWLGYLITSTAGLGAADGVYKAAISLATVSQYSGRTIRIYGLEYSTDQSGSITDYTDLAALTKTAAYLEITANSGNSAISGDVTSIIEELQGVSGWGTSSPFQFVIEDTGAAATGLDTRLQIDGRSSINSRLSILMDDGSSLTPSVGVIP